MTNIEKYILPLIVVGSLGWIVFRIPSVFLSILIAIILATLLEPIARFIANIIELFSQKRNSQSVWDIASVVSIFIGISIIALFVWIIFPIIYGQLVAIYTIVSNEDFYLKAIREVTDFVSKHNFWVINSDVLSYIKGIVEPQVQSITSSVFNRSLRLITELGHSGKNLVVSIIASIHNIFNSTLAMVLTFHILREWNLWNPRFKKLENIPIIQPFYPRISVFTNLLSAGIANWIRGQLFFAIIMSIYYIGLFSSIKLSNSIAIGFIFGFGCFMPYIGDLLAFLMVSIDLLYSGIAIWKLVAIIAGIGVGHAIGGHLIGPLVIGNKIGIHPIEFTIGFMINASLFGFIGVILNAPFCIIANSFIRSTFINLHKKGKNPEADDDIRIGKSADSDHAE